MTIAVTLLLLNILVCIFAVILILYTIPFWKLLSIRWLIVLAGSFYVVSFCTLGVYSAQNVELQILFSRMRFLTLGLLPPSWLMFLASIYKRPRWLQNPYVAFMVFFPGLVTTLLTILPGTRDLIIHSFNLINIRSFMVLQYKQGAWFQVHYLWAMLLVATSLILGMYLFFKERGMRRYQIVILTLCSILAAAVDIFCVLTNSEFRWLMLASSTFFISLVGIVFSALRLKLLNLTSLATHLVFQEFPDPVIVIDGDRVIRLINKATRKFFELKKIVGENIEVVLPQIPLRSGELALIAKDGEKHFFNISIEKLATDSDEAEGQIIYLRQITVQKSIENRLNENLEFKARLLSLMAHDLSGQMEGQALVSASLQEDVEDDSIRERIDLLTSSTLASQSFVENVLEWVRSQQVHFELIKKDFEWNTLIKECMEEQVGMSRMKNIHLKFESEKWPLVGAGDSNMLASVIRNLLSNAIRATNNSSQITIQLKLVGENARVEIKDRGVGMNEEVLSSIRKLSSNFSVTNEAHSEFKSFGIGLTIVKHFIFLHGGKFEIQSTLGSGTEVAFEIPLR